MAKRVADPAGGCLGSSRRRANFTGSPGDSLNGITDSIRTRDNIEWVGMRNEEAGRIRGRGRGASSPANWRSAPEAAGLENMHLINGLYDCQRSRVPVLAIAAQVPSAELGSGYFQETNPVQIFAGCSHYLRS